MQSTGNSLVDFFLFFLEAGSRHSGGFVNRESANVDHAVVARAFGEGLGKGCEVEGDRVISANYSSLALKREWRSGERKNDIP